MPPQHMYFFSNLQYFIVGTLDSQGRPWASILTGNAGFIRAVSRNHLAMVTDISEGDPLLETLNDGWTVDEGERLIAGLGIDLTNRRRNKGMFIVRGGLIVVAGRVGRDMLLVDGRELQMIISTDESLGNCPKVYLRGKLTVVYHSEGYKVFEKGGDCQVSGSTDDEWESSHGGA